MKKIILLFTVLIHVNCTVLRSQPKKINASLSGCIEGTNLPKTATLTIIYPERLTERDSVIQTEVKSGRFRFDLNIMTPRQCVIAIGQDNILLESGESRVLLLSPGDNVSIQIKNTADLVDSVTFTGEGFEKFVYYKEYRHWERKWIKEYRSAISPKDYDNPQWWRDTGAKRTIYSANLLDRHKTKLGPQIYNILLAYRYVWFHAEAFRAIAKGDSVEFKLAKYLIEQNLNFDSMFSKLNNLDAMYAGPEYTGPLLEMMTLLNNHLATKKPINSGYFMNTHLDLYYKEIDDYLKGCNVQEFVLASFISRKVRQLGLTEELKTCINDFLTETKPSSDLHRQIAEIYENGVISTKYLGKPLPEFAFTDSVGKQVSLESLSGKVLLLDFWYTGCINCIKIQPSIQEIEERFAKDDFLVVSVSIDKDKYTWLKSIPKYTSKNSHKLYTGGLGSEHPFIKFFNYDSYPSLIVIGKNGELIIPPSRRLDTRSQSAKEQVITVIQNALTK
jgi:thiol-disulfide isomerase/thioredoxin